MVLWSSSEPSNETMHYTFINSSTCPRRFLNIFHEKKHTQITFRKGHGHFVLTASRNVSSTSIQFSARNGPHGHCWKCPSNGFFPFLQRLIERKKMGKDSSNMVKVVSVHQVTTFAFWNASRNEKTVKWLLCVKFGESHVITWFWVI